MRFSSTEQAEGNTILRQTTLRAGWLKDHPDVTLDTALKLTDSGRSAFNRDEESFATYALGKFVDKVKNKEIKPGSYLLLENLDRLSREDEGTATELLLSIVNRGIIVVQLMPQVVEFRKPVDLVMIVRAVVELSRGHSESAAKRVRRLSDWVRLRQEMRQRAENGRKIADGSVVGHRLPGWIVQAKATVGPYRTKGGFRMVPLGGRLELDKDKAATVRRIFDMALAGNGTHSIALALNTDKVPVMGRTEIKERGWLAKQHEGQSYTTHKIKWNETVVYGILTSRATFGEYLPGTMQGKKRKREGDPIEGYYPPVIKRDTWLRVQQALKSRSNHGSGRRGKHINVLAGLLKDARDGGSLTYKNLKGRAASIIPVGAKQGTGTTWSSFAALPFERAIRSALREVKAEDIAGDNTGRHKVDALRGEKAELERLVAKWTPKMDDPDMEDIVTAKLKEYGSRLRDVKAKLADAERDAANPLAAQWKEFRTLADMDPAQDTDDRRTRIKAALRGSLDSIWCLFTTVGRYRVAAVQVWFRNGQSRDYTIYYDAPRSNKKVKGTERLHVASVTDWDVEDLRTLNSPDSLMDAASFEASLQAIPAATIEKFLTKSAAKK
jgi:DNA invertase Pin-like site-specific DNA recombinase